MTNKISKKETLVLLDTHAILHRAYHALPDFSAPDGTPTGALYGVVTMILKIIEEFSPDYLVACYDLPDPTYRHNAYAEYKGTRSKTDESLVIQIKKSYELLEAFGIKTLAIPGFEADDILGTLAAKTKEQKNLRVVIASGDMDTLQCVDKKRVVVYTLKKGIKDTILYDEATVKDRYLFGPKLVPDYKGLRGDSSDNIPGIPGIGEKTATSLITQFGSLEQIYKKLKKSEADFLAAGIKPRIIKLLQEHEEEAIFSKMLATIRTDVPVEFIPEEARWRECADTEKISELFGELGFRSLSNRVQQLFAITEEVALVEEDYAPELIAKGALLLWLLESDRTNATVVDLVDYGRAYLDSANLEEIVKLLEEKVRQQPAVYKLYQEVDWPLSQLVKKINQTGITLDVPYLAELSKKMHKELRELEKTVYLLVGREFNLNSPKQLGEVLFTDLKLKPKNQKKTAGGQFSTRESELEKLQDEHPVIKQILRYRELQKLTSTYVDALPKQVDADGRLRTTFLVTGTVTGRLASREPNLQNIPIRTKEARAIRRAFVASPGYQLVSIDYSQIELRIAAILSGDEKMREIFRLGKDVHTSVAAEVFGVPAAEITKDMRRQAKVINFGILYGMGVNALRQNLGGETTRAEAQHFLNTYFSTYTGLAAYLEEVKETVAKQGYSETMFGRRRYFPGITSHVPFMRAQAERMAINAPIQGTEADVIRIAMNKIDAYFAAENLSESVKILLQVHDELVFEIKEELLGKVIPKIMELMTTVIPEPDLSGVPISVDVAVGQNWEEMTDWEVDKKV